MKNLLKYLNGYKKETILAPLFKMLEASFELLIPLVVQWIVDIGIGTGDKPYVLKMCLVMILLGIIGLVCSITAQYYSAKAAVGFGTKLRHALFAHMQSFSYAQTDRLGTSTMITNMTSDVNQVQNGVNMVLRLFLRSPFIVLGAMVMAFTINVRAALIFVVVIPLLLVVVFGVTLLTIPLYKKVQKGLDHILGITRENLTGVRVIRAFHKEEDAVREFAQGNDRMTGMQKFVGKISAVMNPVTYVIVNGGIVMLLWSGALKVDAGILTTGAVMALVNYMSQILVELVKLANLIILMNKAVACGNRVQDIFALSPGMEDGIQEEGTYADVAMEKANRGVTAKKANRDVTAEEADHEVAVEFDHVSLVYPGAGDASLTDIHFKAYKGQTIGIIGGTGAGKSSLVNLIPRFYSATGGSVKVAGREVTDYTLEALRRRIGVVPQKAVLFKGTIRENLLMGNKEIGEEALRQALEISQSAEFVDSKPEGMETAISQSGKNLSGGQKQRLTIARALARKPEILILDDSASALDYATDARLRQAVKEMEEAPTVFIVSQRASSLMYADSIIVLEDGEAAGLGTHEELLVSCPVYQEIYYSQYPSQRPQTSEDRETKRKEGVQA